MASRSLGELLLRPSSITTRQIVPLWTTQRSMSHTPRRAAQPSRAKEDSASSKPTQAAQQEDASAMIKDLFSSPPQSNSRPTTSADELRIARGSKIYGAEWGGAGRNRPIRRRPGLAFDSMAFPDSLLDPTLANKPTEVTSLSIQQEETFANYPRLSPAYGRTIDLDPSRGRDIVRGIGMLGSMVARNKVRRDFEKQRYHERPGLKRKRLVSERWRARFKVGFRQVTGRVTELTKKGW
ncbi:hypothetical protein IQ07DRAFT_589432 [Pyrenochaeta sp. DS3sAY3a]|nr:hypothetical protein IQ07DRAFT_589432 [Pyrenochaeta sp. DS3sAY3a]